MAKQSQAGQPQKIRLPLMGAYSNRDSSSTKDQRFVNMFPETRKVDQLENTKIFITKRPGLSIYNSSGVTGEGRGMLWFNGAAWVVIGNTLYRITSSTTTAKQVLTTSTGYVGMINANSASIGNYVFFCDGVKGYIIKSDDLVTAIVDADFPTPHVPTPTFIDGYIVLAKGSDVYTSVLDNPLSWVTDSYLTAEMFPDAIRALARQNNQVVVLGHSSIEFFYDAANAAGSPLSRNDSTTIQMGTAAPYAIYQNEQFCLYISASESGGRAGWLIKGFQPQKITDEYIERLLDAESDMDDCRGFGIRTKGHLFYVINLKTTGRTLVYDVDEKLWHEWSTNTAGNHGVFTYDFMCDPGLGYALVLHSTNGTIYKVDVNSYVDNETTILCDIVTNKYDMDSYHRKFISSLKLVGDSYSPNNIVSFYWTDDDYQTWSNEKQINMNDDYPAFQRLGFFRRRAFRFFHNSNAPLRLESVEVEYQEGAT